MRTGIAYQQIVATADCRRTVFTGPIDEYFGHRFGALPYRSLRFEHEHLPGVAQFQPVGTVNYPNDHAYTRITEFKHLTGQQHAGTSIVREIPAPWAPAATRTTRSRTRPTKRCSSATKRWPRPRATSSSSGGSRSTATTTWTRWWPPRSPPAASSIHSGEAVAA